MSRWEPDRRSNYFFFSTPAHLCAVTCMTEISLNTKFNSTQEYENSILKWLAQNVVNDFFFLLLAQLCETIYIMHNGYDILPLLGVGVLWHHRWRHTKYAYLNLYGRTFPWQWGEKEDIWLSPLTKAPTAPENPKSNLTTQKRHQKLDYTTNADRLRTVSLGNDSHQIGVVNPVYGIQTFPLTTKPCNQKDTFKNL